MMPQGLTTEFSICLLPEQSFADDIASMRAVLPESPYRDDRPHTTLLRGISSTQLLADEALLADVSTLGIDAQLPLAATVRVVKNGENQFYRSTGGLVLAPSAALLQYRQRLIGDLQARGFAVESGELERYVSHITIRLGVPLAGDNLQMAQSLFMGRVVNFSSWMLLRLVKDNDKRLMHEVLAN